MSNFNLSDCLTFGLVILFLLGALIAGPSLNYQYETDLYLRKAMTESQEGVIETFTLPGKVLGNVHIGMIDLYNYS